MRHVIYRLKIRPGILPLAVMAFLAAANLVYLYFILKLAIKAPVQAIPLVILSVLPFIFLDIIFFPLFRVLAYDFLGKPSIIIYENGIKVNRLFMEWKSIKSISLRTGRLIADWNSFRGLKLPVQQKIFLLDSEGNEYSCIVDVDYFLKKDRERNNVKAIKEVLADLGKTSLLSDWAEKR